MNEVLGIIDRGVGGLGLYNKIRESSNRPILYFADNINQPYGLIEATKLKARLDSIINVLKEHGATKIILACNSASVVYPDTDDIKGVIPFGVHALTQSHAHNLGYLATLGTVKSGVYDQYFKNLNLKVIGRVAQPFAIHVENGIVDGDELEHDAQLIMEPLKQCDAILMACTHFPAITHLLQRHVKPNCQLIDPMDDMQEWISKHWPAEHKDNEDNSCFLITGSKENFINSARVAFNVDITPATVLNIHLPL